jgi:hypothetical protein
MLARKNLEGHKMRRPCGCPIRSIMTWVFFTGALTLTPLILDADTITENFTVPIGSVTFSNSWEFGALGLTEFNPADGTLTGVSLTLTGSATVETQENPGALHAELESAIGESIGDQFFEVFGSSINFDLSGAVPADSIDFFTGTGDYGDGLLMLIVEPPFSWTISSATPLSGTVQYTFTPPATAAPEPGTLVLIALLSVTMLAFGAWSRRRGVRVS